MRLKAAAFVAAFAVVTSMLAGSAAAQDVSLDPAEVAIPAVGENITFALNVDNIDGLFGWQIDFVYDNAVLSFVDYSGGDFLKGSGGQTIDVGGAAGAPFGPDADGDVRGHTDSASARWNADCRRADYASARYQVRVRHVVRVKPGGLS